MWHPSDCHAGVHRGGRVRESVRRKGDATDPRGLRPARVAFRSASCQKRAMVFSCESLTVTLFGAGRTAGGTDERRP